MAKVLAMYRTPTDPAAFDRYDYDTHVPLARRIPGLRHYEVMAGPATALASPAGQATAADLANFATGGVDLFFADTRDV